MIYELSHAINMTVSNIADPVMEFLMIVRARQLSFNKCKQQIQDQSCFTWYFSDCQYLLYFLMTV